MGNAAASPVLGVSCFTGTVDAAAGDVVARAREGAGGYACLCSAHGVVLAHHDEELRSALGGAWRVFPDGWPVARLARSSRIPGTDLMASVLDVGREHGLRHFLYGSTPYVLDRLRGSIERRFPGALVVGALSPSFAPLDEAEAAAAIEQIGATRPHVVWIGFSTPKQDVWMRRYADALAPAVVLGVGAAFDFIAGTKKRAPGWMQRAGLEWFHRLASEPRRLAGRYARITSEFAFRAAADAARRRT